MAHLVDLNGKMYAILYQSHWSYGDFVRPPSWSTLVISRDVMAKLVDGCIVADFPSDLCMVRIKLAACEHVGFVVFLKAVVIMYIYIYVYSYSIY